MIGRADPMIAAIALQCDFTRVTGNLSHYQRIQALGYSIKLDNWWV
jgi:predicted nucleic acid-binding protein